MQLDITFYSAFLIGLFGGVHCIGMCGGMVAIFSLHTGKIGANRAATQLPRLLLYNLGRITSYTAAGVVAGGIGAGIVGLADIHASRIVLASISGAFMIALGLHLAGWWSGISKIERLGAYLWRYLQPLGTSFIPLQNSVQAFLLGLIWGWLPCGLVYSVLIWSISAGSAVDGALLMLSFGLGTLPNLLFMGVFAQRMQSLLQNSHLRRLSGVLIITYGLYFCSKALAA